MTRRQGRSLLIIGVLGVLALAAALVFGALEESIVFFRSPTDVVEKKIAPGQRFRLGGLVVEGSVKRGAGAAVQFTVTDLGNEVRVTYIGLLPDLFREGQGVVTEGVLERSGVFAADNVLAKHDETYMPPEVAALLKKQGAWRGGGNAPAAR